MPPETRMRRRSRPDHDSINSGRDKKRSVWPVGAVSNTTTSHVGFSICFNNSSKASASSSFEQYLDKVRAQPRHEVPTTVRSQGSIMPRIQRICFAAVIRCGVYDKKMAPDPPKGNTPLRWPHMNLHGVEGFQTNLYKRRHLPSGRQSRLQTEARSPW